MKVRHTSHSRHYIHSHSCDFRMAAAEVYGVAGFEMLEQKGRHSDDLGFEGRHGLREPFSVFFTAENRQIGIAAKLRCAV